MGGPRLTERQKQTAFRMRAEGAHLKDIAHQSTAIFPARRSLSVRRWVREGIGGVISGETRTVTHHTRGG
jgi:hypothetical protein